GRHPFKYNDLATYTAALRREPEQPPSSGVPRWIHAIVLRGLRSNPAERFATMVEMLDALERDPWKRRTAWALSLFAAGACALGAPALVPRRAGLRHACDAGEAIIATTWNPSALGHVKEALTRAGGSHGAAIAERVVAKLGEYAQSWPTTYRQVSEATL